MTKRTVRKPTISAAWEESLYLFFQPGLHRYDSRGDPCIELEDLYFDIQHPNREPRISPLFPKRFIPFIDSFTERLLDPQVGHTSMINDRLFRWRRRNGTLLNQMETELELLREKPEGRYAIIGFWDPELDLGSEIPVGPIATYFRVRSDKLHGTVVTRTLDALTGAVQLIVGFANLQAHYAEVLGVGIGGLRVLALSYHLHDMDLPRVQSLLEGKRK
jgi:hypothetical protein